MRHAATLVLAALIAGGAATASAQTSHTPLRGVSIGMTRGAMSAALPSGFRLLANLIVRSAPDQVCGSASFDRRNVATELILFRCFFGADAMTWAEFAEAINTNYFGGILAYAEETWPRLDYPPATNASVRMFTGQTSAGETIGVVEILEAVQPITNGREVFVRVIMTPTQADPVERPRFD